MSEDTPAPAPMASPPPAPREPATATTEPPAPFQADLAALREQVEAALDRSIDRCARCKVCDTQVNAVMAAIGVEFDRMHAALEHAESAAAGSHEGVRLWMLDCGELVAKHRARAEAAEAKAAHAVRLAERWALLALAEGPVTEKDAQAIRAGLAALRGDAQDSTEEKGGAGDDWSFTEPAI